MKRTFRYFAFGYLGLCIFLSIVAYLVIPDPTRNANRQIQEFALRDPGVRVCFVCEEHTPIRQTLWSRMVQGEKDDSRCVSLRSGPEEKAKCIRLWFGSDKFGRDVLSRIVVGIRYTLIIGLGATIGSVLLGLILGSLAGYFGGRTDQMISILINIFWSLPTILLAFAVILSFGRTLSSLFIAISLTMWGDVARLVRGQVLQYKEMPFIQAARVLAYPDFKILFQQILPNILSPVWVNAAGNFALAVLLESGMSFLGFGLQPPVPTLGNILQEQYVYALSGKPLLALIPCIIVVLLILSFQILTSYLKELADSNRTV